MNPRCMREAIRIAITKMRANCCGPVGAVVVREGENGGRGRKQVSCTHLTKERILHEHGNAGQLTQETPLTFIHPGSLWQVRVSLCS